MKKKLSKILGVGLALVMVLSLGVALMPVNQAQAAEGDMLWGAQPLPATGDPLGNVMLDGSNVGDIAVAGDGQTIYAINNGAGVLMTDTVAPFALYKSTNAGQSFAGINLSAVVGATAFPLGCVAVAPDDPNYAAISTRDATPGVDEVFITTNGGISWSQLPAFDAVVSVANVDVMDLAVGPARGGTLYGRDYMAAIADDRAATTATADVQLIGGTATWTTTGQTRLGANGKYDYMACQFSPSFAGDRTVAVIGADNSTAAGSTGVHLQIIDVRTTTEIRNNVLNANVTDYGAVFSAINAADIALPSDWDPTATAGQRTYCCTASDNITNDSVYRVDNVTPWNLAVGVTGAAWNSIAYSGTIDEGKLFAGAYTAYAAPAIATNVSYASDPHLVQPTWRPSTTPPTGATGRAVVRVAPDFGDTNMVFVGTTGNESAFSVSYNAGVSYQQETLIDSGVATDDVGTINDIKLTPDGGTLFMATDDTAQLSLWKTTAPPSPTGWSRMYCVTAIGPGLLAVNPDYDTVPALIFKDNDPAPAAGAGRMYVSVNGGDTYARRYAFGITARVGAMAMQDADVVYIGQGSNVFKSTDACVGWGPPKSPSTGPIFSLDASVTDLLLVGGTGACAYSTDAADSFTPISSGLPAAGNFVVCSDSGYADNNLIYAANINVVVAGLTYRYDIGTGGAWADLGAAPTAGNSPIGVASSNGALYSMDNSAGAADECNRNLDSTLEPGVVAGRWDAMNTFSVATANNIDGFAVGDNHLYCVAGATPFMWAYDDYLATAKTALTGPADGTVVSVDPVSGRAMLVTLSWDAMGTGTGLANVYHILLAEAGTGFTAPQSAFLEGTANNIMAVSFGGLDPTSPSITVEATTGVWNIALNGGTAYEWMVRAFDEVSLDSVRSGWSAVGTFSVAASTGVLQPEYAGPILQAPTPGAQAVSITPGFSWAPIPDAVKYEFELSISAETTARGYFIDALVGLTGENALVTPGWQCDVALDYDTSYFWHVKSIAADGAESIWGTAQFTTIAEAAVPVPPAPPVELPAPVTPAWIWAIVAIGAVLVIVVIVLIVVTRRP